LELTTIAVIGADTVGRGIASIAALAGYRTIIEDVSAERLEMAAAWIAQVFESRVMAGTLEPAERHTAAARLSFAHTVEHAIRDADLIMETLPDEMEMQVELFIMLDKFAKPNALFANTGSLSITELAEVTFCADRCIGMRFPEIVREAKVIELTKGSQTSAETIAACTEVARRMGKDVVLLDDAAANKCGQAERKFSNAQG
jgi:3-hydroxybutyryl-CoA dehydrogenase